MGRKPLAIPTLLLAVLALVAMPGSALAGHEQRPEISGPVSLDASLMESYEKYFSSSVWLMTKGYDPRLTGIKGQPLGKLFPPQDINVRGVAPQAGGGQGPLVPYRSPSPKFSRNILVTRDFSGSPFQTEPSLAVDPTDPEHIILGVIDYNFPGITTYNSIDGGATWAGPSQVKYPMNDLGAAGDPVIAFDRQGNAYAAAISVDEEEFTIGSAVGSAAISAIPIALSKDGGQTWEEPTSSARVHVTTRVINRGAEESTTYELSLPFLDKPWLTVGPSAQDASEDVIYVTYTKFLTRMEIFFLFDVDPFTLVPVTETSIELVRSEDGGRTWSEPIAVSPVVQSTQGEGAPSRVVQGSQPVVAPDGTLYVTWVDSTDDDSFKGRGEVYVARSSDDGRTFVTNRAADFSEIGFSPRNAQFRFWGSTFPQIAAGPDGQVYVLYTARSADKKTDDGDIFFAGSVDRGETWTRKQLNDDDTARLQFFPSIATSPDGTIHAMWGDMRDDPVETRYHIYYTSSEDGGKTWIENARVTDFPSNPNYAFPGGAFIGDYFTIKATDDDVYMAWPDARLGEYGPVNQKVAFARKQLMPLPSIFLSPPSGPGGKDIAIQGSNFQPDQNVFLEISGAVISTVRSDPDGRFNARVFVPISGEGAHDFRAIDASGNIATGSFFMDFGFDNIQTSIQGIVDQLEGLDQGTTGGTGTGSDPDLASQLRQIEESLGGLGQAQTRLQELDQLQGINASLEQLKAGGSSPTGTPTWLVVVIAAVAAIAASSLGLVVGLRMVGSRSS